MVIFITFKFYPFIRTLYLSLFLTNVKGETSVFKGFDNYIRILTSESFHHTLKVSFHFAFLVGVSTLVLSFILALLAAKKCRYGQIYEVMYSLPMAVASAPAAAIWLSLMAPGSGLINWFFNINIAWIVDPKIAIYSVAIVTVWLSVGASFIFMLTGLRNVPLELIDSSLIDGASYFQRLIRVIIPIASPQIFFVVFLNIVSSFQAFGQIRIMTAGGPNRATDVLIYNIYRTALIDNRFETACVQSIILFLIIFIITRIQFIFEEKVVNY